MDAMDTLEIEFGILQEKMCGIQVSCCEVGARSEAKAVLFETSELGTPLQEHTDKCGVFNAGDEKLELLVLFLGDRM
jgi:hypothetical protein